MLKKVKEDSAVFIASTASVVDGKLILSMPEAVSPTVWQLDLEQTKSAALEVQEDKKRKYFVLMLRHTNGETQEIAPFENKQKAVDALMVASSALQKGQEKIRNQNTGTRGESGVDVHATPHLNAHSRAGSNKIGGFLAIVLIIIIMLIWSLSVMRPSDTISMDTQISASNPNSEKAGVPVSADEFLSGQ